MLRRLGPLVNQVGFRFAYEWPAILVVYGVAVFLRLQMWHSAPYGDEGMFFSVARRFWGKPENYDDLYGDPVHPYDPFLFWHRPFFHLLMTGAARISFDAYRLWHLLLTSFLPVLCVLILRDLRVRPLVAYAAGLVAVLHPVFFVWGVIVWPDSLMTTALAASIWAAGRGWPVWSAAFALAGVWTKETAFAVLVFLAAWSLWPGRRAAGTRLYPLRLNREQTAYLGALILAPYPIMVSFSLGMGFPGGPAFDTYALWLLDRLFLVPWILPLLLLGLWWERSRKLAALALLLPATFLVLHLWLHRSVESWYLVGPAFFALVGAAVTIDEAWARAAPVRAVVVRHLPKAAAIALAAVFTLHFAVSREDSKGFALRPLSDGTEDSIREQLLYQEGRDQELKQVVAYLEEHRPNVLFAPDVYFPMAYYPLAFKADFVISWNTGVTRVLHQDVQPWIDAIEKRAELTLIQKGSEPLNEAIRATYANCIQFENGIYAMIAGGGCVGNGTALLADYDARVQAFNARVPVLHEVSAWITDKSDP